MPDEATGDEEFQQPVVRGFFELLAQETALSREPVGFVADNKIEHSDLREEFPVFVPLQAVNRCNHKWLRAPV